MLLLVLSSAGYAAAQRSYSANEAPAGLKANSQENRTVAFELREGDNLIGQPSVTTRLGTPASVAVAGRYKLDFTIEQSAPGAHYRIRSSFYRPAGDGWALVASPSMTVAEGQRTSISINRMSVTSTVSVTVR